MKKILVPVDGSPPSHRAVQFALDTVSGDGQTSLEIISVQPPVLSGNVARFIPAETIQEYYDEEGRKALADAMPLLQDNAQTRTQILVGPVAETIAQYAKDQGCSQIIMGSRGLGNVSGLFLGSIATRVLSLVDVPVTLIK